MRNTRENRISRHLGFTLVEVLMVIMIISVLTGMILGITGFANRKAAESRAAADIQILQNALEEHKLEYGYYPVLASLTNIFVITNELEKIDWVAKKVSYTDPWEQAYQYENPDIYSLSYTLISMGMDGKANTDDDITQNGGF